jgi:RNAse (barnase) inhibitor barstar
MATTRIIEVDLSGAAKSAEVHERLAAAFGFPSYYGKNWDAFWDCITTLEVMPQKISVRGVKSLSEVLPREAALLKKCLEDFRSTRAGAAIDIAVT